MMDHPQIEHDNIVDRYLMSQLSGQEEALFEEHLLGCSECLEQLGQAEDFQHSLRAAVSEEVTRTAVRAGVAGWLSRRAVGRIALGLLVAVAFAALLWRTRQLSGDLERLRLARSAAPQTGAVASAPETQPRPDRSADLEKQLDEQRSLVAELTTRVRRLTAPQINTALITLAAARSSGDEGAPVNQLTRPESPGWLVLAMELALVEHETYGVELRDGSGRKLWEQDGLRPDALDTLTVSLHSSFLDAGDYVLELSATGGGRRVVVGRYRFRMR